jgi:hypothetical protein
MSDFVPSDHQARAIEQIEQWHKKGDRQVFRLFGYARTGKTTVTRTAIAALGLSDHDDLSDDGGAACSSPRTPARRRM